MGPGERERVERGKQALDDALVGTVALLGGLALDPLLVVLEVGLRPAERVEKLVTLLRRLSTSPAGSSPVVRSGDKPS